MTMINFICPACNGECAGEERIIYSDDTSPPPVEFCQVCGRQVRWRHLSEINMYALQLIQYGEGKP